MNTVSSQKRKYELKARADAQEETRQKIAAAAASLHEEVGVAHTTVTDIAKRAGVQRLTVYNHFPDLESLLPACSAHWLSQHAPPDPTPLFAIEDPAKRLRKILAAFYGWYREGEAMQLRVQGERSTVPELEAWMASTADVQQAELAGALAAGFGRRAGRVRPLIRVALDFWTWRRLKEEGLTDAAAAGLMAAAVTCEC